MLIAPPTMEPAPAKSVIILIAGGHAAGKKTTAGLLLKELSALCGPGLEIHQIDMKNYETSPTGVYSLSKAAAITVGGGDGPIPVLRPSRFDFGALKTTLSENTRSSPGLPQKVFIVHGLYALYNKELRDMSQLRVFIAGDPDTRLIRWIRRDVVKEGSDVSLESVINRYLQGARPEMSDYIFPTKEFADVVMPRGAEANAVSLLVDGTMLYLAGDGSAAVLVSAEHLRGTDLLSGRFDDQKGKFYELN